MKRLTLLMAILAAVSLAAVGPAGAVKPGRSVTISLSQPIVVFGGTVTLSGAVSDQQAGQKVVVLAQPYGQATFLPVATVDTGSGGSWTYTATPKIQTAYEAKSLAATSSSVAI